MKDEILKEFADKLGTTTEREWDILVGQVMFSSIVNIIIIIFIFITLCIIGKLLHKYYKSNVKDVYDDNILFDVACMVFTLVTCIFILITLIELPNIIYGFINPECVALKQLIN